MIRVSVQDALPNPAAARRAFDRASASFADASQVHDRARRRLLERLEFVRIEPALILDLGCATGAGAAALAAAYPAAQVVAVDSSAAMLAAGRRRHADSTRIAWVRAAAERLPLADRGMGLVLANMLLPWLRPERLFSEVARVLGASGLFLFSTLGPDSLEQLRRAWAAVDDAIHVHAFVDMHDLGDLAIRAGLAEPVLDVERIRLTYADVRSLVRDLRACGGVNLAAGRRRGLTGRELWRAFEQSLLAERHNGRFAMTMELILGQAWGAATRPRIGGSSVDEHAVPVDRIGGRRR